MYAEYNLCKEQEENFIKSLSFNQYRKYGHLNIPEIDALYIKLTKLLNINNITHHVVYNSNIKLGIIGGYIKELSLICFYVNPVPIQFVLHEFAHHIQHIRQLPLNHGRQFLAIEREIFKQTKLLIEEDK
jgi:hypothetical protein